ncbi:hypothetical protein N7532_011221 [Penicillium argentinense]|uniref:Zn(2)-C6 fungal-type domain-containing protein n=1 Tax=Penicillium argentinense TaxID=1131581 RepID=A0A9W9EI12_9EURO|nr:uncharacterized protein N7532_011221 [Penicillium argentinense]KAJ5082178.1 hypothetical protein N7532_011221 [Penicillium argentinense]
MAPQRTMNNISIRCNRDTPRCDKCEATGTECVYPLRKQRTKKQGNDIDEKRVLLEVLHRLKRLEDHCGIEKGPGPDEHDEGSMSVSSVDSETTKIVPLAECRSPISPVVNSILDGIKDAHTRSLLLSNVFCHLRTVESCIFQSERCMEAIRSAMSELQHEEDTQMDESPSAHVIQKEAAKESIRNYFDLYKFEGFKIPIEKDFVLSIPDLMEIPHVQLDTTSQIIYNSILLQQTILNPVPRTGRGGIIRRLYKNCENLSQGWILKRTPADLFAAIVMVSMALESCNSELAWKMLDRALKVARSLGYFSVDGSPEQINGEAIPTPNPTTTETETEVDRNRKRFEFWHLLRTDCLFRLSFGKPTLIPPGSWKVNFPDPTITGVDDEASHFIQIHFLASMRLAIIVMKYLDWIDSEPNPDPSSYDAIIDSYIGEVESIMSDWDIEKLLAMAKTHVDTWFCVDMIFSSYKMLIILYQSKKCNQGSHQLPRPTVDFSRKSLQTFRTLLNNASTAVFGMSLVLFHQFIPFFILCLEIIESPQHDKMEEDIGLVSWISSYTEEVIDERNELKPVMVIMKVMESACKRAKIDGIPHTV